MFVSKVRGDYLLELGGTIQERQVPDGGCVGGRLSTRRRPDERIGFVVLSRGAHPSSTPDTALRDLCPILSLVGACHLPAMRSQEFTTASLARQSLAATFVARSRWHPRSSRHLKTVRAAHSIAGRARVSSPARCPALSRRARRRCLRLTGNRMCGASLAGYDRFLSRWAGRIFHQRQRSYGNASLVAPRSLIAMPCLSVLDGFRVGNSAHTRASAQRGVRRSRPRLTSAQ